MNPPHSRPVRALLLLLILDAAGLCSAQTAPPAPTAPSPASEPDRAAALALPWKEFDQTPGSGWRWYVDLSRHRYSDAVRLIEAYLEKHDELLPRQRALCHFHAAHSLLFRPLRTGEGEQREALPHLEKSLVPDGATPPSADWNDLVRATRAFVLGDRPTLLAVQARVAAMPPETVKFLRAPCSPADLLAHLGEPFGAWFSAAAGKK